MIKKPTPPLFLYVLQMLPDVHKVGVSRNPEKRLRALQQVIPFPMVLLTQLQHPSPWRVEHAAHTELKEKKIGGEWFRVTEQEALAALEVGVSALAQPKPPPMKAPALPFLLKGAKNSARKRNAISKAAADKVRDRWGAEGHTATALVAETGFTYHTIRRWLGRWEDAAKRRKRNAKRAAKLQERRA